MLLQKKRKSFHQFYFTYYCWKLPNKISNEQTFCLSFMSVMSVERIEGKRGEQRIGERPAKSLDIEIGGRFPLILNKEHKVVLFPPGFQTVQNPPGVKHDPLSLSLFLSSRARLDFSSFSWCQRLLSLPLALSPPPLSLTHIHICTSFPFFARFWLRCGSSEEHRVYWCYKFNFSSAQTIVQKKGGKPQKGLHPGERIVSLSFAIVRVTVREIQNLPRFFPSPSFSPFEEKNLPTSSWTCTHARSMHFDRTTRRGHESFNTFVFKHITNFVSHRLILSTQ